MRDERVPLEEARRLRVVGEAVELRAERVARVRRRAERPRLHALLDELAPGRLGVERRLLAQRLEVALVDESAREAAQRGPLAPRPLALEGDAALERVEEHVVAAAEPLAQPLLPRIGEERVGLRLVGHAEARHDRALERPLLEDLRAEGVDGRDGRPLQRVEGDRRSLPLPGREPRVGARALEPFAKAQLHRRGRVLRERDRGDLVEPGAAARHDRLDAVDEQRRLAGPGARLDDERRLVVASRALARRLVGRPARRVRHRAAHETSRRRR